jgi:hypothetical protein
MTANFPSAYEIGNAVGNSLNPKLNDLQNQLNNIAQYTNLTAEQAKIMSIELEAIKVAQAALLAEINTMRQMAIARARTQSLQAKEKLNVIAGEVDEKKYELDLQKNVIQADYDKSQLEFIGNFAESVSADTKSIDEVKEDYKFIASMMKAAFDDSNALVALSVANFKARLDAISEKKKRALDSMNQFLGTRKGTVTQITKMQTKISRRAPCTVYVPFWMIGLKRGDTPRYIVLPVLESLDPAPPPPREAPYQDHLSPHPAYSFASYLSIFENPKVIEIARSHPVRKISPHHVEALRPYFDTTDPGGESIFWRAMKWFIFKR